MTRFSADMMEEVTTRLTQLGLSTCSVCGSGSMKAWDWPAVISVGGVFREQNFRGPNDDDSNILFHIMVMCDLCGHTMFFHAQHFRGGDEPAFAPRAST